MHVTRVYMHVTRVWMHVTRVQVQRLRFSCIWRGYDLGLYACD